MIIDLIKPKFREKSMRWLQATALLAFCFGILLPKIFSDQLVVSFISGMLLGYSIVGNLFCLYHYSRKRDQTS